jgi:hypothetical protein
LRNRVRDQHEHYQNGTAGLLITVIVGRQLVPESFVPCVFVLPALDAGIHILLPPLNKHGRDEPGHAGEAV